MLNEEKIINISNKNTKKTQQTNKLHTKKQYKMSTKERVREEDARRKQKAEVAL